MDKILEDIRRIEFEKVDYHKQSDDYFESVEGRIPVLISAPHGARHLREGKWKGEDEYTTAVAVKLGALTEAYVIYVKNKTVEDSNYEGITQYKRAVKNIVKSNDIRFLADIHGADISRDFKVDVGIIDKENMKKCSCPTMKTVIAEGFKGFQKPLFNQEFSAGLQGTMTHFARHFCGIEAAQFEINAKYRIVKRKPDSTYALAGKNADFKADEKDVLEMIKRLQGIIIGIANHLK